MRKIIVLTLVNLFFSITGFCQCDISESDIQWQTDGIVYGTAKIGNKLFIGGSFSSVSVACGNMLNIDPSAPRSINLKFPAVTGTVKEVVSDGSGGWIVAGTFTKIGGQTCTNLARVRSDFTVDNSWTPVVNGPVTAVAVEKGNLYIAGAFTTIDGIVRQRLACFDLLTLTLTSFTFNNSWTINSLAVQNNVLYVAGQFSHFVNPSIWSNMARINLATLALLPPFGNIIGSVNKCVVKGNAILISGPFTHIGSQSRSQVALLDTMGTLKPFNPAPNGTINTLLIDDNRFYLGGAFTQIGGLPRNRVAAFNLATASILTWSPDVNNEVNNLFRNGSKVYIQGAFTAVGSSTRNNIAAFDTMSLLLDSFSVGAFNGAVSYSACVNNRIILSGNFSGCNIYPRVNLAAFNLDDYSVLPWNPGPQNASSTNTISSIGVIGSSVIVGGAFAVIAGQNRKHVAMFDTSGNLLSFDADISGSRVNVIATGGNKIFIGGDFTTVAGAPASNICAFDASTFSPALTGLSNNGIVRTLSYHNGLLYIGGQFTTFNNQPRNYAACVDASSGLLTNWSPVANNFVFTLHPVNGKVYLGGGFTEVNGTTRKYLASVDTITGLLNSWDPAPNALVQTIYASKNKLFVGGAFTQVSAVPRKYMATYDEASHTLLPIQVSPDNWISNITVYDSSLFVCGGYFNIDDKIRRSFSIYNLFELVPTPTPMSLYAVAVSTSGIRLNWDKGNGNGYIVLARENGPVNANPINNVYYSADANFGSGQVINADNYVVYKGSDTTVIIQGLNLNNTYSFAAFCYNTYGSCIIYSYSPSAVQGIGLPVNLVSFGGIWKQTFTQLNWVTVSEVNGSRFEIERSQSNDGSGWHTVGSVKSAGNRQTEASYSYKDYSAAFFIRNGATLYYRLNHLDHNNKSAYSRVVAVSERGGNRADIYPTMTSRYLTIDSETETVSYKITAMSGAEIKTGRLNKFNTQVLVEELRAGAYFLEVTYKDGSREYTTFFKQ